LAEAEARLLRGLPACWEQSIPESALEGVQERAKNLAARLEGAGRKRNAQELRRRIRILERADELHRHASDVETIAGLYRALSAFARVHESIGEHERAWVQAGLLDDPMSVAHGPAFRETAALRNRAYRLVTAAMACYSRAAQIGGGRVSP
jgi:hypothetical protein